ncbi:MAG TPA: acyloxyacyl hydrolase [Pyrinomonadaceae bacterium]|nr:acyloxyacyl hydrolase [Pyrinomonadaceae bacterium]
MLDHLRLRHPRYSVVALVLIALTCSVAAGQDSDRVDGAQNTNDSDRALHTGANEFGVWGGLSFHASTLIGGTPDARFVNLAFRYGRVLAANNKLAFEWTIDVEPVAVLSLKRLTFTQTAPGSFAVTTKRERTYATGASPIGLKFNMRPQRRVQPFANTSGGFLYFRKDVPVPGAARFNFTFDFGGGVQIINGSRHALMVGYKFQHISNGGASRINTGIDVHVVYAGFSIFR